MYYVSDCFDQGEGMNDFKIILDNSANVAASIIKNVPEKNDVKLYELLKYKVDKNTFYDNCS